jgi:hypothetical protein
LRVGFGSAPQGTQRLSARSNSLFGKQSVAKLTFVLVQYLQRKRGATTAKGRFCPSDDGNFFRQSIVNVMRRGRTRLITVGTKAGDCRNSVCLRLRRYRRA